MRPTAHIIKYYYGLLLHTRYNYKMVIKGWLRLLDRQLREHLLLSV